MSRKKVQNSIPLTLGQSDHVVVFMVGLVSEQVAQLRYDRREDRD
jgi:hypothetical protein